MGGLNAEKTVCLPQDLHNGGSGHIESCMVLGDTWVDNRGPIGLDDGSNEESKIDKLYCFQRPAHVTTNNLKSDLGPLSCHLGVDIEDDRADFTNPSTTTFFL